MAAMQPPRLMYPPMARMQLLPRTLERPRHIRLLLVAVAAPQLLPPPRCVLHANVGNVQCVSRRNRRHHLAPRLPLHFAAVAFADAATAGALAASVRQFHHPVLRQPGRPIPWPAEHMVPRLTVTMQMARLLWMPLWMRR